MEHKRKKRASSRRITAELHRTTISFLTVLWLGTNAFWTVGMRGLYREKASMDAIHVGALPKLTLHSQVNSTNFMP